MYTYLAQTVKYLIKISKNTGSGNFRYIIQGFACIIANSALGILEAFKDRWNQQMQVSIDFNHKTDGTCSKTN